MIASDREQVTADEARVEEAYRAKLVQDSRTNQRSINQNLPNTLTASIGTEVPKDGDVVGRIALTHVNESIGTDDFYVGSWKVTHDDFLVLSWVATEVGRAFYRSTDAADGLAGDVAAVRVFAHEGNRIVDYQDQMFDDARAEAFPKRQLVIRRAPRTSQPVVPPTSEASAPPSTSRPKLVPVMLPKPVEPTKIAPPGPALRAPEMLRRQLAAPKTASMSAVLATLQPDQYEAITRPSAAHQFLQGHPGTGKTIIAAHRAAYLLHADTPADSRPRGDVLIVGPTTEYADHIRRTVHGLTGDTNRCEIIAIPSLLEDLAGLPRSTAPTDTAQLMDVDETLVGYIDEAYRRSRAERAKEGDKPTDADVYAELKYLIADPAGMDSDWYRYIRDLPATWEELRRKRIGSYRGLMAYIGVRTRPARGPGHIIVDEAQDIHPIEWAILGRLGNSGGWTILGDLNQRRTDHTFDSWDEVAGILAIENEQGKADVHVLERGYRSTAQIIRFANQLLPPRERALYSLQQDGEAPRVERVTAARQMFDAALREAEQLINRVEAGTVAIISMADGAVRAELARRGWSADFGDPYTWRRDGRTLRVLPPPRARGLEFDGVVVVEPADFPENVGRLGVLYTALTRANRLLTVVHHRALPRNMKASP